MNVKSGWQTNIFNQTTNAPEKIKCLRLSNDSKHIYVGTDSTLLVLDPVTGKELRRHNAVHKGAIIKLACSTFNNWVATIGQDNKAIVWEGADVQPYKRFTLGTKATPYDMFFNRNETTLYIMTNREVISFILKGETTEKEIKRTSLGDKDTVTACLVEKLGVILVADASHQIIAVDLDKFERVTLSQKLNSINTMKYFDNEDTLWVAYSNNTIGVYPLNDSGLINFNALERKTPFEVLTIERVSEELLALGGFHNKICLFSSSGHLVTELLTIDDSVLLRHFCIQRDSRQLILGVESRVECFDLLSTHNETFLNDFSVKIRDLCTVEVGYHGSNSALVDPTNTQFKLNGLVRSTHFCKQSYFAILFGEGKSTRVQLVDWKMIESSLVRITNEEPEDKIDLVFNRFADKLNLNEDNPSHVLMPEQESDMRNLFDNELKSNNRKIGKRKLKVEIKDKINPDTNFARQNKTQVNQRNKVKILKGEDWLGDCRQIYVGGSNLYFVLPQKIVQTDFNLRILHFWNQPSLISHTEFHENAKRKESVYVGLVTGEIYLVSADNSFPVEVVDHKVSITFFQVSKIKDKILVVDSNKNMSLYNLQVSNNTKPIFSLAKVVQAGFSRTASDLLFVIDEDVVLHVCYSGASFVLKNMVDKSETVLQFSKNELVVYSCMTQQIRTVEINLGPIYSQLIKDKKTQTAFELMTAVCASQNDFKKLGISALRAKINHPFVIQAFQLAGDSQLMQLARDNFGIGTTGLELQTNDTGHKSCIDNDRSSILQKNASGFNDVIEANLAKENQHRLQAEMLAAEGKFQQAVDYLLKEKQPALAIEMLITLGKYEQAVKILRNPMYSSVASLSRFDLTEIIRLQGEEALRKNEFNKAIEFFSTVNDYERVVFLLVQRDKSQELINLIRDQSLETLGKSTVMKAFEYFREKMHLPYAKECLMKANEEKLMVDLLMDFENYEEALVWAEKMSKKDKSIKHLERVYLPYANSLLAENRFEEALNIYLKTTDFVFCENLLRKMIMVNVQFKNYKLVSKLHFFMAKIKKEQSRNDQSTGNETVDLPTVSLFYSALEALYQHNAKIVYQDYNDAFGVTPTHFQNILNCLLLILDLLNSDECLRFPGSLIPDLEKSLEIAWTLGRLATLKFLLTKLAVFDPSSSLISKYSFLSEMNVEQSDKNTTDYFYECTNCASKGFETNKMNCPECGVGLFFSYISGKQIRVVKILFSEKLIGNGKILNSKNFNAFETKSNWSRNEEDEFMGYVKENMAKESKEGVFQVNTIKVQGLMNLRKVIPLRKREYLYWGRDSKLESLVFCQTCLFMADGDGFEEIADQKKCLNCGNEELKSAINC